MKYLDYSIMPEILSRYFPDRHRRLVGPQRTVDSGYLDLVRFFGEGPDPAHVRLSYLNREFSFSDKRIESFATRTAAKMKAEGRLHDGPPATHVVTAEWSGPEPNLELGRCHYHLQAGSCFAMDIADSAFAGKGETLREYYLRRYGGSPPGRSPLPACLGVCGLVLNRSSTGHAFWFARRSAQLASLESSIGPTAAGSVDYSEELVDLNAMTMAAMEAEIDEELGLAPGEYILTVLAYGREIFRGEKPQLFCLIETAVDKTELALRLAEAGRISGEADRFIRIETDRTGDIARRYLDILNHEAAANLHLAQEYLVEKA